MATKNTHRTPEKMHESQDIKAFNIRMTKEMWIFLKKKAVDSEMSMNSIIIYCLDKYRKKSQNNSQNNVDNQ